MDNLLGGNIDESHPFFERLVTKGAAPKKVLWFQKNPSEPYQKDLDFYAHCFKVWFRDSQGRIAHKTNPNPPSLASVIADYKAQMPKMKMGIGETNVRGTVRDRITFFKWVLQQCAQAGISRVSWWGLTDADAWGDGNLTRFWRPGKPDPVGIYTLTDHPVKGRLWNREVNEFSEVLRAYAHGQLSINDIPAYQFSGELKDVLNGYTKQNLSRWQKHDRRKVIQKSYEVSQVLEVA
jgi:hypothetical protein